MARKKDAKALFEVITGSKKSARPLGVPGWFGQAKGSAPAPSDPGVKPPGAGGGLERPAMSAGTGGQAAVRPAPAGEPMLSVAGGRVRISLNQVSATVAVIGLMLLVVAAFVIGRRTAPGRQGRISAPERSDVLRVGSGEGSVVPVPTPPDGQSDPRPVGMVPDDAVREKGANYLVVQGGIRTPAEAEDVKRFLYKEGIQVTIHKGQTGRYLVWDTKPFRNLSAKETRAELADHIRKIEELGKKYMRQGGDYDFRQNASSPWMLTEK